MWREGRYVYLGFVGESDGKESVCNVADQSLILARSPGEDPGKNPQYFYLENPTDRGAWRAMVHGVAKSWTQLNG